MFTEEWQIAFIESQANPLENTTFDEFCKLNNVSRSTLYRWRKENQNEISKIINEQLDKNVKLLRPIAFKALAKKMDKDTNALKMYFQMSGDLVEKSEVIQHLSIEQKRALAQDLIQKFSAQLEQKATLIPPTTPDAGV
jgi:hypothetical protein